MNLDFMIIIDFICIVFFKIFLCNIFFLILKFIPVKLLTAINDSRRFFIIVKILYDIIESDTTTRKKARIMHNFQCFLSHYTRKVHAWNTLQLHLVAFIKKFKSETLFCIKIPQRYITMCLANTHKKGKEKEIFFQSRIPYFLARVNACWTTLSTLNPNSFITLSPGADAPKWSTPMITPCSPAYFSHP